MTEGAVAQTAIMTIGIPGWVLLEQGFLHRPYYLDVSYVGIPGGVPAWVLTPTSGWYETNGQMVIHAQDTVLSLDGTKRYIFTGWTTTTGAAFDDDADTITWFPFYQSHFIAANYNTQYKVGSAANTYNDEAYSLTGTVITIC